MEFEFANRRVGTDTFPYEILSYRSPKVMLVRSMSCNRTKFDMDFYPGGFFGHVSNQDEQAWEISSDPQAEIIQVRMRKDGCWRDRNENRYVLANEPIRFHDYNF